MKASVLLPTFKNFQPPFPNGRSLHHFYLFRFGFVEILARRQVGVFFKMLRLERFGNGMLATEPFAEVNELAAMRTERAVFSGQPVAGLFRSEERRVGKECR